MLQRISFITYTAGNSTAPCESLLNHHLQNLYFRGQIHFFLFHNRFLFLSL